MPTRLNKYISESGVCSRREADRFIEQGNVLVNGKRASIGDQVTSKDRVSVNGIVIEPRAEEDAVYIAYNKPPGIISTTDTGIKDNIIRAIKHSVRIFPIGRLDRDSQGLILLTSNGDIVNKILRAGNKHEKEYIVMVDKPINDLFIEGMANGVPIGGTMTQPCKVTKETPYIFRIILVQGLNRQIRRMCEYFGYEVVQLERIRVMNINVKGLGVGEWRELKEKEMKVLFEMIKDSDGTDDGSTPRRRKRPSSAEFWADRPGRKGAAPLRPADAPGHAKPAGAWVEKPTGKRAAKRPTPAPTAPAEWPTGPARANGPATGVRPDGPGFGKTRRPAAGAGSGPRPRGAAAGKGPKSAPAGPPKGKTSTRGTRGASRPGKRS
ncbi:23S rRNA pseudouridine(2604) synthase RluF [Hymenobacter sediminis]|uniref:23S rRNA pseudouridine(2604) synthase RluF n=1 Tax=Hymenobacter sediminis TaxID=2218621 RepID=UPI000DA651CF|nr:23S rRNA pseudouridine(2604) synthase RluF [Hymenobacter sediminis]RPD44916.1 23S rRNA pseudouridine(2604) synthase RluF [Hymenobacter sediminis]